MSQAPVMQRSHVVPLAGLPAPAISDPSASGEMAGSCELSEPQTAEEIFARYSGYVLRVAYRIVGRQSDAEDVVQDVFALVWLKLDKVLQAQSIRMWLAAAAVRVSLHVLRHRRLRKRLGLEQPSAPEALAGAVTSPEELHQVSALLTVLASLPLKQRAAWMLRHVEGETLEDVAKILSCSTSTAKRWLARAERALDQRRGHE